MVRFYFEAMGFYQLMAEEMQNAIKKILSLISFGK
jgi:hypothetical protein